MIIICAQKKRKRQKKRSKGEKSPSFQLRYAERKRKAMGKIGRSAGEERRGPKVTKRNVQKKTKV